MEGAGEGAQEVISVDEMLVVEPDGPVLLEKGTIDLRALLSIFPFCVLGRLSIG